MLGSPPGVDGRSFRSRYRFKVIQWNFHDEFSWYWMLEFDEERVNGGLAKDWLDGKNRAAMFMARDEEKRWHHAFIWDHEERRWVSKGALEHT